MHQTGAFYRQRTFASALAIAGIVGSAGVWSTLQAQVVDGPEPLTSLKRIPVPGPSAAVLAEYVRDKGAAIQLGKALFWDMQVGSDGVQACASCHFAAGADTRVKNQLSPGLLAGDKSFQVGGPNYTLSAKDFPFTRHVNPDVASTRTSDKNDVVASQGVFRADFVGLGYGSEENCQQLSDVAANGGNGFHVAGTNTRQVEPRNTPTNINAVFNFRNFWDGRAVNDFNGGDPFGQRNPNGFVYKIVNGGLTQTAVAIPFSSLASQASGPPLSAFEMSCNGRTFERLGKKLLALRPLGKQRVHSGDGVLGQLASSYGNGLRTSYSDLISRAFQPAYWSSTVAVSDSSQTAPMDKIFRRSSYYGSNTSNTVSQMEANFALFFGLSLQLYQATLVSDDAPVDRFFDGTTTALSTQQQRGLEIFRGHGQCINCHGGAETTNASVRLVLNQRLERMIMSNGSVAVYDNGFYNIGVRPTQEDLGVGGTDPFGNPLSETRITQRGQTHLLGAQFDPAKEPVVGAGDRVAVDGAFKTPTLRNVELTGPYFHNGGKATLKQVVEFYNRGGDFADENRANLDPDIRPLGLTEAQQLDLVSFLVALTDDRVRFRRAPFDHPAICIPDGHPGNEASVSRTYGSGINAADAMRCIAAVGSGGSSTPLRPFLAQEVTQTWGEWGR